MSYNKEEVLDFLPHRDPFLFIDSVESVTIAEEFSHINKEDITKKELVGSKVVANFKARADHPIFEGHFPGNPVLPGVVQIEMMAQASIFIVKLVHLASAGKGLKVALLNVTNAKFRTPILPGMELVIKTNCTRIRGNIVCNDCTIYHEGKLVAESTNLATIEF